MELERNSYLVSSSMKKYLVAAIASTLIQTINTVVDGILMGQFIGTEAFSAINLCLPVVGIVICLSQFFFAGSTVCASIALGARENEKANGIFTVSMISVFAVSILVVILGYFGLDIVSNAICREEVLLPFVEGYLIVYFIGSPATMISSTMSAFVDVGGMPKLVTVSSVANMLTNIICDVFYVKVLGTGVEGAALATISGAVVSLAIVLIILKFKGSPFKLIKVGKDFSPILQENLRYGVPVASVTLSTVIYSYIVSICAQIFCGVNGAFVVSVISQCTSVCQGVSAGVSMSVSAIGGLLTGQRDYRGVQFLYKKGLKLSIFFSGVLVILAMIFIGPICQLLGAKSVDLIAYSTKALRMALIYILPITIVWGMPSVYAIAGQLSLIPVISVSQPIITGLALVLCGKLIGNDYMWLGFPIAGILILGLLIVMAEQTRKKSEEDRSFFSLLLKPKEEYNIFDISVSCSIDSLRESLLGISGFFEKHNIDDGLCMRVRLCSEELMMNIIENSIKNAKRFLDYKVIIEENSILAIIKDDGKQFDPIHSLEQGPGLKIVNGLCSNIDYKYTYGQNMIFMSWDV